MTKKAHKLPVAQGAVLAEERSAHTLNPGEIAQRAHQIFEARGSQPGADLDDWLEAERELQAANGQGRR